MLWISICIVAAVAWYTFNLARVAWRGGNRGGAAGVAILAFLTFAVSCFVLLVMGR